MSTKQRREKEKQEIRNKIFEAATSIILAQGYEKLSMRKIAERIEYSPTIIYSYFKDKEDIVNQIILENYYKCIDFIREALERHKNKSVEKRLQCTILAFVKIMMENAQQFRAVLISGGDMAMADPEEKESGIDILNALIQEGVGLGIFRKNSLYTAEIIVSNVFGLVFHMISHKMDDVNKIETMTMEYTEMILTGIVI